MKAISLWQPWASLWLSPRKVHETRHWYTRHRGPLVVHAAKKFIKDLDGPLRAILDDEFGGHWAMDLPTGALLGVVELVACKETSLGPTQASIAADPDDLNCGDFSPQRFAWQRSTYTLFKAPVPYIGRQGLFSVEDALIQEALR